MSEITCIFSITSKSKELDIAMFNNLLGMEPDKLIRIGDQIVSAHGVVNHWRHSSWSIRIIDDTGRHIEALLQRMVDRIYPHRETLHNAMAQYSISMSINTVTLLTDEPSPSCALSPELITKLAELRLPLDMTILQGK